MSRAASERSLAGLGSVNRHDRRTQEQSLSELKRLKPRKTKLAINTYVGSVLLDGSDLSRDSLDGDVQRTVLVLTLLQL